MWVSREGGRIREIHRGGCLGFVEVDISFGGGGGCGASVGVAAMEAGVCDK